jgi:hypothetical protein
VEYVRKEHAAGLGDELKADDHDHELIMKREIDVQARRSADDYDVASVQ